MTATSSTAEEPPTAAAPLLPPAIDSKILERDEKPDERCNVSDVEKFRNRFDDLNSVANELEHKVGEVVQFYARKKLPSSLKGCSTLKEKDKESDAADCSGGSSSTKKEALSSKRMQELMRQFGTILKQISQHKWAWPFMEPVDVEGLRLHDYHVVIKTPMDFSTIRNQMDCGGYKHVREIYSDVRLVFMNAMTYNEERSDVHVMAKTLLEKFEEKWLLLLPKVIEEETRQKEETAQAVANMQVAQEAAIARMARDADNELNELTLHLKELREMVIKKCRKLSVYEKRKLGEELSSLSLEDLDKALEIIAQDNNGLKASTMATEIDLDAQSQTTLWKLKIFLKSVSKNTAGKDDENQKRKKEICDALAKTAKRRNRKIP